jgi:hypothetical protein
MDYSTVKQIFNSINFNKMTTKVNFKNSVIALAIGVVMVSCGGRGGNQQQSGEKSDIKTAQAENKGGINDNLFDIPADQIRVGQNVSVAEIPKEMFKGVGKVNSVDVWAISFGSFKYNVVLKFQVKSNENAVKTLMNYYKSVGATVEETGNTYNPYSVVFEWGEATEVRFGTFEGEDFVNVQFGVVKK